MKTVYRKKAGVTLLESVIAFLVLLIAILYILQLYATGQGVFLKSQFRTEAIKKGQEKLETARTNPGSYALPNECVTVLSGNYYSVSYDSYNPATISTAIVTYTTDSSVLNNIYGLAVTVQGPYRGSTCGASELLGGNVIVKLRTFVARQTLPN